MPFKINISHNGKTYKVEIDNENILGKKIGETLKGDEISQDLNKLDRMNHTFAGRSARRRIK